MRIETLEITDLKDRVIEVMAILRQSIAQHGEVRQHANVRSTNRH